MAIHGWLGPIAAGWPTAALWTVGKRSKTKNHGLQEKNLLSLSYGNVVKRDIADRSGLVPESYETYQIVEPGDVIFRFTDLQNDQRSLRSALVDERGIMTSAYINFRPNANIIMPSFLAYFMRATDQAKVFYEMGSGVRQTLNYEEFARLQVPLPSLAIQRAIADYLDRETAEIDAMMADLEKMETLLTERRDATVEKLLLGGGTPELEGLPEGWTRTTLGTVFSFHNGDRGVHYPRPEEIKDEGIPFINAGDLINGSVDLEGCKRVSPEKYAQMGGAKLQRGDILFCLRGSLGKWGLMESDGGSLASSLCALRNERTDLVDVRYIAHAMSTRVISLQIWFNESGSAQPNLGAEQVARFRVPLPPLEEQHRIVDVIDRETAEIDDMLADITELRELLAERRAAVIAAAVTGQIDIPTAEEPTHA